MLGDFVSIKGSGVFSSPILYLGLKLMPESNELSFGGIAFVPEAPKEGTFNPESICAVAKFKLKSSIKRITLNIYWFLSSSKISDFSKINS
jgi:hypothetical protein